MVHTLESIRREIRNRLSAIPVSDEQAQAEAGLILEYLAGRSIHEIYRAGDEPVSDGVRLQVLQLLESRTEKRIPIQYLSHGAYFFGLELYVNPHVLIPRPETELLVEKALSVCQQFKETKNRYPKTLDIGTGSGAIAIALSHKLGEALDITATDLSAKALKVAGINQRKWDTHVNFKQGDLLEPVQGERFDLILCNPPYIDPVLMPTLSPEVVYREPHSALFPADGDAYSYYRRLANEGPAFLNPDGQMLMETGKGMAKDVLKLTKQAGFQTVGVIQDYAGIDRIIHVAWIKH